MSRSFLLMLGWFCGLVFCSSWGGAADRDRPDVVAAAPSPTATASHRTDLFISGVYPHLTTYGVYSQGGAHLKDGHQECGIGAIVPWAGQLWMVNYAPHMPKGSEHKLFSIAPDLRQPITVEMVMQEINRYADSEFRYADKSDEVAIENAVREMGRMEEAKRRYLEGKG